MIEREMLTLVLHNTMLIIKAILSDIGDSPKHKNNARVEKAFDAAMIIFPIAHSIRTLILATMNPETIQDWYKFCDMYNKFLIRFESDVSVINKEKHSELIQLSKLAMKETKDFVENN